MDEQNPQAPVRIPLAVALTSRDATLEKDSLLKNCFTEASQLGNNRVVKRSGSTLASNSIVCGNSRGIFMNPQGSQTTIYYIDEASSLQSFSL